MPKIHARISTPVAENQSYPPNVGNVAELLRTAKRTVAPAAAAALEATAAALTNLQSASNSAHAALRKPVDIEQLLVTDSTGKVIAAIGDFEYGGVTTPNYFSEIHVGDPLNTGNPALALFNAVNGHVTIGQNGIVEVLDPFGGVAAWLGAQADMLAVTGAVNNGAGLIRLTVVAHTLQTGDTVAVANVGGVPNATGIRTVTVIDASHLDLQSTVFVGAYTSGGTVNRLMHITAATNAAPSVVTITGHTYENGDTVNIVGAVGNTAINGQRIVKDVTTDTFTLTTLTGTAINGNGAYTGGGASLRYFAGMLAQTLAIGESFANYKLRAFADGELKIKDASIEVRYGGSVISIDPSNGLVISSATALTDIDPGVAQFIAAGRWVIINPSTSPKVYVFGASTEIGLDLSNSDQYANLRVIRNPNAAADKDMYIGLGSGATSALHLYSNNTEILTVKNGGRVGINNAAPAFALDVTGNFNVLGSYYVLGVPGFTGTVAAAAGRNVLGGIII